MSRPAGRPEKALVLSRREAQVALLIALGKTNKQIAAQLDLSEQTVKEYVSKALRKTECRRRSELAACVARSTARAG